MTDILATTINNDNSKTLELSEKELLLLRKYIELSKQEDCAHDSKTCLTGLGDIKDLQATHATLTASLAEALQCPKKEVIDILVYKEGFRVGEAFCILLQRIQELAPHLDLNQEPEQSNDNVTPKEKL